MTGIGAEAIRCASQSTRASSVRAVASSGGRASGSVTPVNRTKSRFGSRTAMSSAWSAAVRKPVRPDRLASTPKPVTSSGLCAAANGGRCAVIAAAVSGENSGITRPCALAASAMMSQEPPDRVSTPIRRPRGQRWYARAAPVISSSSRLATRMMLSWRSAASTTASSPATEPVWARAASRPAGLEPTFSATIGLPARSAFSAIRANPTGSPISSRNRQITRVASSSTR